MKIRISLKETSTAGSVYSTPSTEAQEQQLPSDDELAIRDKEEADRQAAQLEKEQKEAAKKAAEKAKKVPPVDKAPEDGKEAPAKKEDDSGDGEDEDEEDDTDEESDDSESDEDDEDLDDEDLDDEDADDEEATASSVQNGMPKLVPSVSPHSVPYPDANPIQDSDTILPVPKEEPTDEGMSALNETPEDPNAGDADKIKGAEIPEGKSGDTAVLPSGENKPASQEIATAATVRQRPYPDCWDN